MVGLGDFVVELPQLRTRAILQISASIASFVNTTSWAWPVPEPLHFMGLCLLLGVVLAVDLRILGVMKNVSFAALHKLLPWAILGFGINVITGVLFFITVPEQYTQNRALQWKIVLILLAAAHILYFTMFEEAWAVRSGDDAPLKAEIIAAFTIFLWVGVIYLGRMMPFIGGSLLAPAGFIMRLAFGVVAVVVVVMTIVGIIGYLIDKTNRRDIEE